MLRITPSKSADAAVAYFREQFLRGDYYAEGGLTVGRWIGKGAEMLGLTGDVDEAAYRNLCHNLLPDGSGSLTPVTRDDRRVGYDFTFSVPKSVSIGYLLDKDERILKAVNTAVRETILDIEREKKTRVRVDGANEDRVTGNILAAEFTHLTARPIDGVPDPQLHVHVFVFNATWDGVEGRFKAGQFGDIKEDARYFEALFHNRLAMAMNRLGYITERVGDFWEVGGVSREMIEAFSRRTAHINKVIAELGITDPDEKADVGRRTRDSKKHSLLRKQVEQIWEETAKEFGYEGLKRGPSRNGITADAAIEYALDKGFVRSSVLREKDVIADACRRGIGSVDIEMVRRAYENRDDLIRRPVGRDELVTTQAMHAEEQRFLKQARDGLNTLEPIKRGSHDFKNPKLDQDQRGAVEHVLNSPDWITLIRGVAGTGKTTLMQEAIPAIQAAGKHVTVLAPSITASRDVLRKEGFKEANTLAQFLDNQAMHHRARGQVIWVDEIGQVGARDMRRLFDLAKELNARVIGSGDARQHCPVPAGDALRLMESESGIVPFTISKIKRQRSPQYRAVVELLSEGRTVEGFDRLVQMGWVREFADDHERLTAITHDYLKYRKNNHTALIVAPTHAEGRKITAILRDEMFNRGELRGNDQSFKRLQRMDWSVAEKKDAQLYEPGMVVQFQRATVGFMPGERVKVEALNPNGDVMVRLAGGSVQALNLTAAPSFAVFKQDSIDLAAGDRIRITGKGMTMDDRKPESRGWKRFNKHRGKEDKRIAINNGRMLTVAGFTPGGDIITSRGWVLSKNFGHFDHGYTSTSHAAQGKTADYVLASQPAATLRAASQEQFYVTISRGRERATVYTDSIARTREAIQRSSTRMSATELARQPMQVAHHLAVQRVQEEANYASAELRRRLVQRGVTAHRYQPHQLERGRGR